MRLCRFRLDDIELLGFYLDDAVIPFDHAADAALEQTGVEFNLSASENILDYLPNEGSVRGDASSLDAWLNRLPATERDELAIPISDVQLLTPIPNPPKILLLAGNYPKHVQERGGTLAEREETFPYVFMKPPSTTLTSPFDAILLPAVSPDHVDWECELGVVIGRRAKHLKEAEALEVVAGYTIVNDITNRHFKPNPNRKPRPRDDHFDWLHGKWHDSSCPVGPCILAADPNVDPQQLHLRLTVNDHVKQDASTSQMTFPVAAIIAFISSFLTLEPGDIIATGTTAGVGSARKEYLRPGDTIAATIDGIGTLENHVIAEADFDR
jgi:2-keto-4-pentenoate hydratase/2-oxohepta-3-ene-1,7-dioic acid hydratase in catechol pathway